MPGFSEEIKLRLREPEQIIPTTTFVPTELRTFRPLAAVNSTGIQSQATTGEMLVKADTIVKHSGKGLPRTELFTLMQAMVEYRTELERAGFNTPTNHKTAVYLETGNSGDSSCIEIIDQLIPGRDLHSILKSAGGLQNGSDELKTWLRMVEAIAGTFDGTSGGRTRVLLDAKPANFIIAPKTGKMYYVDVFPPLLRDKDGLIRPYIESVFKRNIKLVTFNFGDIRGMLTKLLALAKIDYPQHFPILSAATLDTISTKLPKDMFSYIQGQALSGFPDMQTFYSQNGTLAEQKLSALLATT